MVNYKKYGNTETSFGHAALKLMNGEKIRSCLYNGIEIATRDGAVEKFKSAEEYKLNSDEMFDEANTNYPAYSIENDVTKLISIENVTACLGSGGGAAIYDSATVVVAWANKANNCVYCILEEEFKVVRELQWRQFACPR